jgi:hypothetical protein
MENIEEMVETKPGNFKQPVKMKYFIGNRSNVKLSSKEALIYGKYLTGMGYEKVQFLLTIIDDETCNFDVHTEGVEVDEQTRGRLLSVISEKTIVPTSFNNEKIIKELEFTFMLGEKEIPVFLAVEEQKPIDKLNSILSEEIEVSEDQLSKLSLLFGDDFIDEETFEDQLIEEVEVDNIIEEVEVVEVKPDNSLTTVFDKMKQQKIDELTIDLQEVKQNLFSTEMEIVTKQSHKNKLMEKLSLLETRIESLVGKKEPNGYYFFVSESTNDVHKLDEETLDFIKKKVSKVKSINMDAFMSLFTDGEYKIYFGKKNEDGIFEVVDNLVLDDDIKELLKFISMEDNNFFYQGDFTWHQIVDKLNKLGFSQDAEFDNLFKEKQ